MRMLGVCVLMSALPFLACGNGDDDGSSAENASGGSSAAPIDPTTFCPSECQRRLDADCATYPPDYQQSCELLCQARYANYPECEAEISAMDRCVVERVTYVCAESGTFQATPSGACAYEGAPCLACTNDMFGCGF